MVVDVRPRGAPLRALIGSGHPKPVLAMTVLCSAMAVTTGRDLPGVVVVAAAVLTGQLSIGWLNDLCDAERDRDTGRADKPLALGAVSTRAVRVAAVTAGLACIPLSLASGILAGSLHLITIAAGWAYDLRLKASSASVLAFVVAMSLSPLFVVYGLPGSPHPPWWLPAVTTLLGCGAHFGNVLRDLDDDLATGVRGLPQRLGTRTSRIAAVVLTFGAVVLLAVTAPLPTAVALGAPLIALLILAAGFLSGAGPRSQRPFQAVSVVGLLTVGLLIGLGPVLH
ncbi:MAG TPA: UbiA family prenyltransferase [Pseudonocardia sp.]|nr:UbiA family prenyltransferase [Pseudonocardia sp.]